ncbi:hypothetical protein F0562_032488 [Nyssa sinensis]|uniref:Cyclin-like domain-containing protein n=1 Tax=Nyssa sinensis TaxID=561372 RepID=A0A5J5AMV9_9ASTE|nr:hypothetical protein F0562_032488 [Nyssa sinensis]
MKPKIQSVQFFKKLRSRLPRRRRSQISPILCKSPSSTFSDAKTGLLACAVHSSAYSHLTREVSCDSSIVSVGSDDLKVRQRKPSVKKRGFEEISDFGANERVRRNTRLYYRQKENARKEEKRGSGNGELELSEYSCVESCSGANACQRVSKLKSETSEGAENAKENRGNEDSEAIALSEISSVQQISGKNLKSRKEELKGTQNSLEIKENKVVSIAFGLESPSEEKFGNICSYISKLSDKSIKHADSDLACSEHLSCEDVSDYSSAFSELQSEIFPESSDIDFSDYTPSVWFESGSQFSERSVGDTIPSPTYSLFLQYSQQFCRSTYPLDSKADSRVEDDNYDGFTDNEDEESYQMFRNRERRQVYLHDYVDEYCSTTEYGKLVIQQRLQMVHWIVEQSSTKDLHRETMFLGVSLLDRFLSKGFFKNKRGLQTVGIACITLATRIEENQPLNSVRQKTFSIGSNVYSRCEVVAMEWLVQEVLNFQCFLPTVYNFLWFYLKAARANEEVEKFAQNLAVLALLGHEQLCYWPSTVAAGLVILASLAANQDASCHLVMETHAGTKDDDLARCIKSLEWLVKYIF